MRAIAVGAIKALPGKPRNDSGFGSVLGVRAVHGGLKGTQDVESRTCHSIAWMQWPGQLRIGRSRG